VFATLQAWTLQFAPIVLIVAVLGGIAWTGHHWDWKVPKFSALKERDDDDDESPEWCNEHGVPKPICVTCNESLLPRGPSYGWSKKFGVVDCPFEHPDVAQLAEPPVIQKSDIERFERAVALKPRIENAEQNKLLQRRLQVVSEDSLEKMGIATAKVGRSEAPLVESLPAVGEIDYEQPGISPVHVPIVGRVAMLTALGRLGSSVKKGDVLVLVDAPEVGKAKTELMQALSRLELRQKTLASTKELVPIGAAPPFKLVEDENAVRETEISLQAALQTLNNLQVNVNLEELKKLTPAEITLKLQFAGLDYELVRSLQGRVASSNLLAIRSPRDGTIVANKVAVGEMVDPAKAIFTIIDLRRMWLNLNVRVDDVKYLVARDELRNKSGSRVIFEADGNSDPIYGEVSWLSTELEEKTRTVPVRVDIANPEGKLRAKTFGQGRVILREEKDAIIVPNEAIHWIDDCFVVFVRDKRFDEPGVPKVFHPRMVRLGMRDAVNTEIIAGVLPGEVIATRNSSILRAELLKEKIGAGE
jgi:cobalt-zinc-cadmium efflux system membrane fusion protein